MKDTQWFQTQGRLNEGKKHEQDKSPRGYISIQLDQT